jgi:hypothetical protein
LAARRKPSLKLHGAPCLQRAAIFCFLQQKRVLSSIPKHQTPLTTAPPHHPNKQTVVSIQVRGRALECHWLPFPRHPHPIPSPPFSDAERGREQSEAEHRRVRLRAILRRRRRRRVHTPSLHHTSPSLSHYSLAPANPSHLTSPTPSPSFRRHTALSLPACLPLHHPPSSLSFISAFTHHLRSFHQHYHNRVAAADSPSAATVLLSQLPFCLYSLLQKAVTLPRTHDLPSEQTIRASNSPRPHPRVRSTRLCLLCSCLPASPRSRINTIRIASG